MSIDRLDLRKLNYIITVADELSFSSAAKKLHISQPPLSQQIKLVETEVGFSIFNRTTRNVTLTKAGKFFVEQARIVLASHNNLIDFLSAYKQGNIQPLRIGSIGLAYEAFLASSLHDFIECQPNIELHIEEGTTKELLSRCQAGLIDAAVIRLHNSDIPKSQLIALHSEDYVIAIPKIWGFNQAKISLADLSKQPYIGYPRESQPLLYDAIESAFLRSGKRANIVQKVKTKGTTLALVKAGIGFAIVPRSLADTNKAAIHYAEIDESLPQVEFFLYHNKTQLHPAIVHLVSSIKNNGVKASN